MSFLNDIERQLDLPPGPKSEVMRELISHYEEIREELLASGMPEAQVDQEAERRLGAPEDVAARLSAVHNSASWKSAALCAAPFVGCALYLCISVVFKSHLYSVAILSALCLSMLVVTVREFTKGRRPVWLPTWLAGSLMSLNLIEYALGRSATRVESGSLVEVQAGAIAPIVFCIITLFAAWRTQRWPKPVTIFSISGFVCAVYVLTHKPNDVTGSIALIIIVISFVALLVYLSRLLFEQHSYGNSVQASLFLLAVLTLRYNWAVEQSASAYLLAVSELLTAAAVVWLARSPEKRIKIWAIWCGLYAWALGNATVEYFQHDNALIIGTMIGALIPTFFMYLIVSIPLRSSNRRRNTPQIVQ